jgi:hypothetical protein
MANITLYDRASPFKRGNPVTIASFQEKEYLENSKTPTYVPLAMHAHGHGPLGNQYEVFFSNAAQATMRISDDKHGNSGEFYVDNFGTMEIWL